MPSICPDKAGNPTARSFPRRAVMILSYRSFMLQTTDDLPQMISREGCNMLRAIGRPFLAIVVALLGLAAMSPAAAAANRCDVSYLWSRSLGSVQDYRDRVARVLGPGVTHSLEVVAKGDLFGLVYARHGDRAGATRVAEAHTRLLQSRGLEAASPVRSQDWEVLDNGDARQVSFASVNVPHSSLN